MLDVILESCEGPLAGVMLNMIRTALSGTNIWNFTLELLNCSHVAIKVRAIHFLGLSLSGNNGEIDPRQVLQFEKIQGFNTVATKLSDFIGDSEAITESLLSLFFWRRVIRPGGNDNGPNTT